MLRTSIIIDYQNTHLTAWNLFNPHGERHDSLIHPFRFAQRAIRQRNSLQRDGYPAAKLEKALVFRGLPHVDYQWEQHRRCLDQATQWRQDGATVELRDLKYKYKRQANGRPATDINGRKIPDGPPQEKGIDVLCALACVREAFDPEIDLVILASRDTDLVPVLDEVCDERQRTNGKAARIETVSWFNPGASQNFGHLRPTSPRRIWNTNLDRSCYEASLDRRDYR